MHLPQYVGAQPNRHFPPSSHSPLSWLAATAAAMDPACSATMDPVPRLHDDLHWITCICHGRPPLDPVPQARQGAVTMDTPCCRRHHGELARGVRRRRHGRQLAAAATTIGPDPPLGEEAPLVGKEKSRPLVVKGPASPSPPSPLARSPPPSRLSKLSRNSCLCNRPYAGTRLPLRPPLCGNHSATTTRACGGRACRTAPAACIEEGCAVSKTCARQGEDNRLCYGQGKTKKKKEKIKKPAI